LVRGGEAGVSRTTSGGSVDVEGIARRVARRRHELGLTQAQLAAELPGSVSYVSRIESGKRRPSGQVLERLAAALGCSLDHLLTGSWPPNPATIRLELNFAELAYRSGDIATAAERYESLLVEASQAGAEADFTAEALYGLSMAREALGDLQAAVRGFQELADMPSLPPAVSRAAVLMLLCRTYMASGDLRRGADVGEAALREMRGNGEAATERAIELVATLVLCYYERGDLVRAQILIDEAVGSAERLGSPRARASAYWNAALVCEGHGHIDRALRLTDRALAIYGELENRRALAMLRRNRAWLLLRRDAPGHLEARPLLERALAELVEVGSPGEVAEAEADLARCHLRAGDVPAAVRTAEAAVERAARGSIIEYAKTRAVLAEALLVAGRMTDAIETYRTAAADLDRIGAQRHAAAVWRALSVALRHVGDLAGALDASERAMDVGGIMRPRTAIDTAEAG